MAPSDESDDADGFVPPLPAEDRLWRHPSEMASSAGPPSGGSTASPPDAARGIRARSRGQRQVVVLSAVAGVVITLGVLAAVGTFHRGADTVVGQQVAVDPTRSTATLETLGPALARLDATRVGETVPTTAVVYRPDGYLLAAADVVATAEQLTVTLADGRVLPATLVGSDTISGVAVVKIDASGLTTAVWGDDAALQPGDDAMAVSHAADPAGSPVVAEGQVTSTGWRLDGADTTRHDLIRAALGTAPVSSAGAVLCSPAGTVLGVLLPDQAGTARPLPGVNTNATASTVLTSATGANAAHFATPISLAVRVADEMVATGRAHYAWLGVQGDDLDEARAAALGRSGAVLTGVEDGGPADQGGLRTDDLIMAVDEQPVRSISELVIALRDQRPGDDVTLSYRRGDDIRRAVVTLSDSPG